jgi:pyruvate dehydrogenase E1 component alpha subunit
MDIDRTRARMLLHDMILIRRFEDRSAEMYARSFIRGFLHLYSGEEAVAVGVMQALRDDDLVLSTYREHGHALARGITPASIMTEMFGKVEGCSRGRGGSMHLFDVSKRFYGGNAIVGGHLPMAVGMALACKKQGLDAIVCCFFGEGAAAEGEFHESLNLASLWSVPVLFVCENNQYAMGTALTYTHAMIDLGLKGAGYGVDADSVDGMDVLSVLDAAQRAVGHIRASGRPFLLVCDTYRFRAHSMFDAELYRDKTEVTAWKTRDPITTFRQRMEERGLLDASVVDEIERNVEVVLREAVAVADAGSLEPVDELARFTYAEGGRA